MTPFIVLGLPRSRTYWLSRFLSYGDWHCGHDELAHMRSLEDVASWWAQPNIGTVETAAAPFWRLLPKDISVVTVRRPVGEALASVMRVLPDCDPAAMLRTLQALDRKLDQVEARLGVLSVRFRDLSDEAVCAEVFQHCLPYEHDPAWWAAWDVRRVSGNLAAQARYAKAYLPQLRRLAQAGRQQSLANLHRKRGQRSPLDGFVFAEEAYETWLVDAQPLFRQHMIRTGQDADGYRMKNEPLGRQLDGVGALQIMTARQNGRMFGYLVSVISPDPDRREGLMAQHFLPFAVPECPGLGRRLQAAAVERLRTKGVTQVYARAGVRGDGPRLGSLYQRMGYVADGTLHRLDI